MRYFLYILGLIFLLTSDVNAQSEWENFRTSFQEAMSKNGGSSETVETEFGGIRLVSCRTGVKDLSGLVVGVDVQLNQNWILSDIKLTPSDENAKAIVWPQFQENKSINEKWTTNYQSSTIFPIWLHDIHNQDVPLTVLGEFRACSTDTYKCVNINQPFNLLLPETESYPTLSCGAIQFALKNAAVDIQQTNVQAENQLLENGDLKIRLIFPKRVQTVEIQSLDTPLNQVFKKIEGPVFTTIIHPDVPLEIKDTIPLNIRSSNGCYTWNMVISDKKLSDIPTRIPFGFGFLSGLLFFFLSPLWCAWMMPNKIESQPALFRKKIRLLQLTSFISIWGLGLCWIAGLTPFLWIQNLCFAVIILICLIMLLIKPVPNKMWVIGLLIFILPKPFGDLLTEVSLSTKIYLLILWTICTYIPFNIWLLFPNHILSFFKNVQTQNIPAYHIIVRLPYIILIGWLGLALTGYYHYKTDPVFIPDKTKGPAIVQVVKPVCLTCVRDRLLFLSNFKNNLYRIDYKTKWSEEKKKLYQIKGDTFYIYIKGNGQEILLPKNLTRNKLSQALSN